MIFHDEPQGAEPARENAARGGYESSARSAADLPAPPSGPALGASPHAPTVAYLCPDYECCENGCPDVRCKACRQEWPCPGWRERHTRRQIEAQVRYVARKHVPDDPEMWDYYVRKYEDYPS